MIEPKTFYRKLDSLLTSIGGEKSGKEFLIYIVNKLVDIFGHDLHIFNGRIYEEKDEYFNLIYPEPDFINNSLNASLSTESDSVKVVLKSKSYIYDDLEKGTDIGTALKEQYSIPVAVVVSSNELRWIFVFDLTGGWVREEIDFCLNAVRRAVNYRLFSEAIKSEMEQAARIQQSLLPSVPPMFNGYDIAALSQPAELVGGDLYDYYRFDENEYGLSFGDASGHGLPAALMVRDVVTGLRMGVEKHMKMIHTLKRLNQVIYRGAYSTSFISLFFSELESNGNIFYVNAGHPAPMLIRGNKMRELKATGVIFGAFPEIELARGYAKMDQGNLLIIYSDGITERKNGDEEYFGEERIKDLAIKNREKTAQEILEIIFNAAQKFNRNPKWEDDATLMVIKKT